MLINRLRGSGENVRSLLEEAYHCLGPAEELVSFVHEACQRDPRAWRKACELLEGRLRRPEEAVRILRYVRCLLPNEAEVCCYLARLVPAEARHWQTEALQVSSPRSARVLECSADGLRASDRHSEAAEWYEAAVRKRAGTASDKLLFRLGEELVLAGRHAEGRGYLERVLQAGSGAWQVRAALTAARSHLERGDSPEKAIAYCAAAQAALDRSSLRHQAKRVLERVQAYRGVAHLRAGQINEAVEALSTVLAGKGSFSSIADSRDLERPFENTVAANLAVAQVLQGDFAAAEQLLGAALHAAGNWPRAELLSSTAYLQMAKGEMQAARDTLEQALHLEKDNPLLLLRMGYLLLCQQEIDEATGFLQKCLRQPVGSVLFSCADAGLAHLYLAVCWHHRGASEGQDFESSTFAGCLSKEHVKAGFQLLPVLAHALMAGPETGNMIGLVVGHPPRICGVDLRSEQAEVLLLLARGVLQASAVMLPPLPPRSAASPPPSTRTANGSKPNAGLTRSPSSCSSQAVGPLLGTASTNVPASSSPSRQASEAGLAVCSQVSRQMAVFGHTPAGEEAAELASTLPAEKVLRLSDLELGECISRGEFAIVSYGQLKQSGKDVVVKSLHIKDCAQQDEQAALELVSEITIMSTLSHPRLVPFVGAIFESLGVALVTALAPGGNLHQALHVRQRQLQRAEKFELSSELLEGVQYLHLLKPPVVHLDLKSMNLLLDAEGRQLQICDFGLARILGSCDNLMSARLPVNGGSPRYMPPECHDRDIGPITVKADIWSVGCILIEIFGGCLPFAECSCVPQIIKAILLERTGPTVPDTVEPLVAKLLETVLALDAENRPSSCQALEELRKAFAETTPESASRFQWSP
eukprot:TRINITY_DN24024_c0_g1_i1.p1 TRINITY_DN24024_c0_g1~~TRINITY_DN24024_c0_g1_i1.p1  ORF type:complete len:973 (-),score=190.64 TRINITY_DN24024_c0_g1_i1:95-2707(-)